MQSSKWLVDYHDNEAISLVACDLKLATRNYYSLLPMQVRMSVKDNQQTMLLEVYDNLVPRDLVEEIFECIHQPAYKFGQKSNPGDTFGFWIANITEEILGSVKPINALMEIVDEHITKGQFDITRMYVNAYNFGDCPTVHTDHDAERHYTMLYYVNPVWHADWSGETVFYNEARDDIIKSVYPTPGRITFFDARIPHTARTPSRSCDFIRYTIAAKLIKK